MKNWMLLFALAGMVFFSACKDKEDEEMTLEPDYHAHITSPDSSNKKVGDTVPIDITFEDHNGGTVHHIKVRVYNKADESEEIYNKPDVAHVHATEGSYQFTDDLVLDGIDGHTDWVLEAKVWGHEAGAHEVVETVEFHVHPN